MNRNDLIELILDHAIQQGLYSDLYMESLQTKTYDELEGVLCLLEEAV
jgi:hypothetical protein